MAWLCQVVTPAASGVVLDPFMGSGTTGVACRALGLGFIGMEMDAGYYEIASRRICDEVVDLIELRKRGIKPAQAAPGQLGLFGG